MTSAAPLPRRKPGLSLVFVALVAVGLGVGWMLRSPPPADTATIGSAAPLFTVELIDGGSFDLEGHMVAHAPRAVVVNLWASWCLPCRTEIPEISAFATDHPDVTVIGVAVQDSESASRAFAAEIGAAYPLALGNPDFEDAYPWLGLPATYVVDGSGRIVVAHNGIVDREDLVEMTEDL